MIRAKTSILLSLAAVMGLSACSDGQMFDENNPNRNTNQGVILGALGGAAAGRLIGGNNDDAVKNTLAGAAAGAIAGNSTVKVVPPSALAGSTLILPPLP